MCLRGDKILNQKAMYVKFDYPFDHNPIKAYVQEVHIAKSLGKSLLHCTIKTQEST